MVLRSSHQNLQVSRRLRFKRWNQQNFFFDRSNENSW